MKPRFDFDSVFGKGVGGENEKKPSPGAGPCGHTAAEHEQILRDKGIDPCTPAQATRRLAEFFGAPAQEGYGVDTPESEKDAEDLGQRIIAMNEKELMQLHYLAQAVGRLSMNLTAAIQVALVQRTFGKLGESE